MAVDTAYQEYMSGWRKEWYQKNRVEVLAKKKKEYAAMKLKKEKEKEAFKIQSVEKAKARQKGYQKGYRGGVRKMEEVYRAEVEHLREENKKLVAKLEAIKREWPDETRMDAIGQNGNNGEHYAKLNDSHTTEINNAKESN